MRLRLAILSLITATLASPGFAQLTTAGNQLWGQGLNGLPGNAENNELFGYDVATGDFDADGILDLAIGSPGEDDGNAKGIVYVLYGTQAGPSAARVQEWQQNNDLNGNAEKGDNFGFALATGDFNGDGYSDLVIGVPGEDDGRGNVQVLYGAADGLTIQGNQIWDQDRGLEGDGRSQGDNFGYDVAVGNFNGDAYSDLAVGAPGENNSGGLVNVIYGSGAGLTANGNQRWRQGADGIQGSRDDGDLFGIALAAGDTNGDGFDELIVGAPGDESNKGQFHVIYGSAGGLTGSGNQRWRQQNDGLPDDRESDDAFGAPLAAGDFNSDGYADIAAGSLGENSGAGLVIVVPGSPNGPQGNASRRWRQGDASDEIPEKREGGDRFGSALAAGDYDLDGYQDLAIGVRGEDNNDGIVHVLYGGPDGLSLDGTQLFAQGYDGLQGTAQSGESFGYALAAGDLGGDYADELVISSPGEPDGNGRGIVQVAFGVQSTDPVITAVVGAGLGLPSVESLSFNSLGTIYGFSFYPEDTFRVATEDDLVGGLLPTNLDNVCVEMDGRRTPLLAVYPGQINFQAVTAVNQTSAEIRVVLNCGLGTEIRSNPYTIGVAPASPEFFYFTLSLDGHNPIAGYNHETGILLGRPGLLEGVTFVPAHPGDILTIFVTGLGETTPRYEPGVLPDEAADSLRNVEVRIGGRLATVIYAGVAPDYAGLYQINVEMPPDLPAGDLEIVLISGGPIDPISSPPGAYLTVEQ